VREGGESQREAGVSREGGAQTYVYGGSRQAEGAAREREEAREELYREGAFRESEGLRGREGLFRAGEGGAASTTTEGARSGV
jgi:hypothetical protein